MAIHLQSFPNIILSYKLLFILSVCAWFMLHYDLKLRPTRRRRRHRRRRRANSTNAAAHSGASGRFHDQMSRSTSLLVVLTWAPNFFILGWFIQCGFPVDPAYCVGHDCNLIATNLHFSSGQILATYFRTDHTQFYFIFYAQAHFCDTNTHFVNSFNKTCLQFDIHCLHINIFCSYGVE